MGVRGEGVLPKRPVAEPVEAGLPQSKPIGVAEKLADYRKDMMPTVPKTQIVAKIVFPVADMNAASSFYRGLGFTVESHDGGYSWVTHGGEEILHLALVNDLDRMANRSAGYFHLQDVADWHAAWSEAGVEVGPIVDHPWQMREFTLHDPDGNLIRVGQNL